MKRFHVLNTSLNRMRFHLPSCRHVKEIAAENRLDVDASRDERTSLGFLPCGTCKP